MRNRSRESLTNANPISPAQADETARNRLPSTTQMLDGLGIDGGSVGRSIPATGLRLTVTSVAVALALLLGGGAFGAAVASTEVGKQAIGVFTGNYKQQPDSRELPPLQPTLNTESPEIISVVNGMIDNPEAPAGSGDFAHYLPPGIKSVSVPPGMNREAIYADLLDLPARGPGELTRVELAAMVEHRLVDAWYRYWIYATPQERKQIQRIIDTFQDLPNMWRNEHVHWDMPGSRMVLLARVAEAAKHGDSSLVRMWMTEFDSPNGWGKRPGVRDGRCEWPLVEVKWSSGPRGECR